MKDPKSILITGAGSGIGKALSEEYATTGVTLYLSGRDSNKLAKIEKICSDKGSKVFIKSIDVTDKKQMKNWISKIKDLDLVIANAGISAGTSLGTESEEQISQIFSTNIDGVMNTINPAIKLMERKKSGQIAIMSSLAGFRGLPSSPAYSASKAAVRVYGEGLRGSLLKLGIKVNVICPGYIKTPMTDVNEFYMPFLMNSKKAVKIIKKDLANNKSRIAFPFILYFVVWLMSLISTKITDPIFAKLPGKAALED